MAASSSGRAKLTWDEETIAEHDKERGTRMKIDEPDTPYLPPYDFSQEDEDGSFQEAESEGTLEGTLEGGAAAAAAAPPLPSAALQMPGGGGEGGAAAAVAAAAAAAAAAGGEGGEGGGGAAAAFSSGAGNMFAQLAGKLEGVAEQQARGQQAADADVEDEGILAQRQLDAKESFKDARTTHYGGQKEAMARARALIAAEMAADDE
jgi:hypothetical protein